MSHARLVRNGVFSSVQTIQFYNSSFGGTRASKVPFSTLELPTIEGLKSALCEFNVHRYTSKTSYVEDFSELRFSGYFGITIPKFVKVYMFDGVRSAPQILNVTGRKYIFVGEQSSFIFDPSTVQVSVRKVRIKRSSSLNIDPIKLNYFNPTTSRFDEVLKDAVNAKKVFLNVSFGLDIPVDTTKFRVKEHNFLIVYPYTKSGRIMCSDEQIITFMHETVGWIGPSATRISLEPVSESQNFSEQRRSFLGTRGVGFRLGLPPVRPGVRSNPMRFLLDERSFGPVRHRLSMRLYNSDFKGVRSGIFNIIRVENHSSYANFIDFAETKTSLVQFKSTTYNKNDLIDIKGARFYCCRYIAPKNLNGTRNPLVEFSFPFVLQRNLYGTYNPLLSFSTEIIIPPLANFDGVRSNWMNLMAGEKTIIDKKGLYKDIFIYSPHYLPDPKTPWTPSQSSMRKLSKWRFDAISFTSGLEVFKIKNEPRVLMDLYWEAYTLKNEVFDIPPFGIAPYIRIESEDKTDFIILGVTPAGGSIIHMHKRGFADKFSLYGGYNHQIEEVPDNDNDNEKDKPKTVDISKAEHSALIVASPKYRRFAKIIKEKSEGVLWEDSYVNEALKYMELNREATTFFVDAPYSPAVLRSIILNKGNGLITKNIFQAPEITCIRKEALSVGAEDPYCNLGLPYIYEDIDAIETGKTSYSYISRSEDIKLSPSPSYLDVSARTFILSKTKSEAMIENCNSGALCALLLMSERSYLKEVIHRPLNPKSHAAWISNWHKIGIEWSEPPARSIDNFSFRSKHFVNLVGPRHFDGVRSNDINMVSSYGTMRQGLRYTSSFSIGLKFFHGVKSSENNLTIRTFSSNFGGVYSDFWIRFSTKTYSSSFNGFRSQLLSISVNARMKTRDGVSNDRAESIWVKIFPQHYAGKSSIESRIMQFHITSREFAKEISFPYGYLDPEASPLGRPQKSGSGDFKEKKIVEIPDILGSTASTRKVPNIICGENRTKTFLEYEGFDHMFFDGDNRIFGNIGWKEKKTIMSAYLRIRKNTVIRKGTKISQADILRKTMAEIKLSEIDDLDKVQDWHIEDFKLEAKDFGLKSSDAERLSSIEDAFRNALKSVLDTIGEDASSVERKTKTNQFPGFPDRKVIGDELSTTVKPKQFFIVEEEKR